MALLKLGSKNNATKAPIPDTLPELPAHHDIIHTAEPTHQVQKIPDSLPELPKKEQATKLEPLTPQVKTEPIQSQPQVIETKIIPTQQIIQHEQVQQPTQPAVQYPIQSSNHTQNSTQTLSIQHQNMQQTELKNSYFARLEKLLKSEKNIDELTKKFQDFSEKNIFDNLKEFHDSNREGKTFLIHKDELRDVLNEKITLLKNLEADWHNKKIQLNTIQDELTNKEKRIQFEIDELKHLMNKVNEQKKELQEHNYFHTHDNKKLKSLSDLKEYLTDINEANYNHHVNDYRHDFANWVEHVIEDQELANNMRKTKNKDELINTLQKY